MNRAAEYAIQMPPENDNRLEQLKELVETSLSPENVRESLRDLVEIASLIATDVENTLKNAHKHPKETAAALVGLAAVAASMALTSRDGALGQSATYEPSPQSVPEIPDIPLDLAPEISEAIPYPNAIPQAYDMVRPVPYPHLLDLDRDLPRDVSVPRPPQAPDKLVDFIYPVALPEVEGIKQSRHEKQGLSFSPYTIQAGDTLSDIIYDEVFQRSVSPYKTDEAGVTHFSDEFIEASKDIAIENLAVGSMFPQPLTAEGAPIGLDQSYNESNENMTVEQQVHGFVLKINDAIAANPGDRSVLRDLFDNDLAPELVPHVLRYLRTNDTIYLPEYTLDNVEESNDKSTTKKAPHNNNSKYFNQFGGRKPPRGAY